MDRNAQRAWFDENRNEHATITGVSGVDANGRGAASGIRYSVAVRMRSGQMVQLADIVPANRRWPDTVDTVAAQVGWPARVVYRGNDVLIFVDEMPAIEECP